MAKGDGEVKQPSKTLEQSGMPPNYNQQVVGYSGNRNMGIRYGDGADEMPGMGSVNRTGMGPGMQQRMPMSQPSGMMNSMGPSQNMWMQIMQGMARMNQPQYRFDAAINSNRGFGQPEQAMPRPQYNRNPNQLIIG